MGLESGVVSLGLTRDWRLCRVDLEVFLDVSSFLCYDYFIDS